MGVNFMVFGGDNNSNFPFCVSMIGTSQCDKKYHVFRENAWTFCVEYILEGYGYVSEDNKSCIASKGDTYLLHGGRTHDYYTSPEQPWKKIWMNFTGPVAEHLIEDYGLSDKIYFPQTNILPYMEEIHQILSNEKDKKLALDKCARIFMRILQKLSNSTVEEENKTIAVKLKEYIDNFSEDYDSLDELIERMHYSKSYAIRSFKEKYNITPYAYIQTKKIDVAKHLLNKTELSVVQIAEHLGFCDAHYFSKFFKKHVKISPSEYRGQSKK